MKSWYLVILKVWSLSASFICNGLPFSWFCSVLNRHGLWIIWCLRNANKTILKKWPMSLEVVPQIEVKLHSKIRVIGYYTVSIIAHYHTSKMTTIFSDRMLGEPQTSSLSRPNISNPCWLWVTASECGTTHTDSLIYLTILLLTRTNRSR